MRGWLAVVGLIGCAACGGATSGPADGGAEGGVEGGPAPSPVCTEAAPSQPTLVAMLEGGPGGLTLVRGMIYYGDDLTTSHGMPQGVVRRVPRGGGTPEVFIATDYVNGGLANDGIDLFFARCIPVRTGGVNAWTFDYPEMLAASLEGGAARALPHPASVTYVYGPSTQGSRGVFYEGLSNGPSSVLRWDGQTTTTILSADAFAWDVDGTTLYSVSLGGGGSSELRATPLAGGATVTLSTVSGFARLFGHDDTHVYFGGSAGTPAPVQRAPKTGGPATSLTPPVQPGFPGALITGGHIYFVDQVDQTRILRVATTGGAPEVFVKDATSTGYVYGLAADECAIYWVAVNPTRLLRQAK